LRGASGAKNAASQPDVEEIPQPVGRKAVKEKKVSRRGIGFTKEECYPLRS
jgi:hypothetical protein